MRRKMWTDLVLFTSLPSCEVLALLFRQSLLEIVWVQNSNSKKTLPQAMSSILMPYLGTAISAFQTEILPLK